jgi:hypothetical protein
MEKFKFKIYIAENSDNHEKVIMTYGRFNPPTILGHGKVIQKVQEMARKEGVKAHILLSHSHNPEKKPEARKNPVEPQLKVAAIQHSFPGVHVYTTSKEHPTLWHHLSNLYDKGVKDVTLISGSDRVDEYKNLLEKQNNKRDVHGFYNLNLKVISAGQRDPDGENEENKITSGSAARKKALAGDLNSFKAGVLGSDEHKEKMFQQINAPKRKILEEDYENFVRFDWGTPEGTKYMMKMTPGISTKYNHKHVSSKKKHISVPLKEFLITNKNFKLGDLVSTKDGESGKIIYMGTNYVTLQLKEQIKKYWITDIQELQNKTVEKYNTIVKYKNKFSRKIPALLMSKSQLKEQNKNNMQISYMDYNTNYLHMSKDASAQLHMLVHKELDSKLTLQAIKATDQYLELVNKALEQDFANKELVQDFLMKLSIANDTLNMLGFTDNDLFYMKKHLDTIYKLSMHKDNNLASRMYQIDEDFIKRGRAKPGMFKKMDSSDYFLKYNNKTGKYYKVKKVIISKGHETVDDDNTNDNIDSNTVKESQFKDYEFGLNIEKNTVQRIDNNIDNQGYENKSSSLVSFKSYVINK